MTAALEAREKQIATNEFAAAEKFRETFEQNLIEALPGSEIVAAKSPRLWNTVSALMPEADCQQRWVVKLDKLGVAVSTGSACSSGKEEPSHVLRAMGYSPADAARVLRFSGSLQTAASDWNALLAGLESINTKRIPRGEKSVEKSAAID